MKDKREVVLMKNSTKIIWGLSLISIAVLIILNQIGLIEDSINPGMIILGALYCIILVNAIIKKSFGGIFLALGLAYVTFASLLELPKINIWLMLLIVMLLTLGFNTIFKQNFKRGYKPKRPEGLTIDYSEEGTINFTNKLGAAVKTVKISSFKGGMIKNSFGELKVYFEAALFTGNQVEIVINNSFGSVSLFVPKEWNVINDIAVFAGDCKEGKNSLKHIETTVVLTGNVSFGELIINYI